MAFNLPYVYDYTTKMCRQRSYKNMRMNMFVTGQGEARHRRYKMLKLGDGLAYDHSSD
jgi:hypothetical protein